MIVLHEVVKGFNKFKMHSRTIVELTRSVKKVMMHDELTHYSPLKGNYTIELFDKFGNLKYAWEGHNDITDVGKNHLLDVTFRNQTQTATWYFGIIDNSGFTAFADADTMATHSGWNEFTTYTEATRVAWAPDAAASKSITNSTVSTFNITGSGTLKGIFMGSDNTKSGTSGILWSTAAFSSTVPVANGDQLKITYSLNT